MRRLPALISSERAAATVLGAVLLFGIVVVGFSVYQAEIVPDQQAETEFDQFETARGDLVALQSAAIDTGLSETPRSAAVTLRSQYASRPFAVNPPAPQGQLETSAKYSIRINGEETIPARFLRYEPGFNRLTPGVVRYEHGLLYLEPPSGDIVVIENGVLTENGQRLRFVPLQGAYQQRGAAATVALFPGRQTLPDDIDTVTIPSRLDASRWQAVLGLPPDAVENADGPEDNNNVTSVTFSIADAGVANAAVYSVGVEQRGNASSPVQEPPKRPPNRPVDQERVAFSVDKELQTVANGGPIRSFPTSQVRILGPPTRDFDDDGLVEVPFVDNQRNLQLIDRNGQTSTLAGDAQKQKTALAAGQFDENPPAVFFVAKGETAVTGVTADERFKINLEGSATASAVLGVADVDGDEANELVFLGNSPGGSSDTINYVDSDGTVENIPNSGNVGSNNNKGVGTPADFDSDGRAEIPIVDGSGNIDLYTITGEEQSITAVTAVKTPIASADVDNDDSSEIAYIDSGSNTLKYVDTVATTPTIEELTDDQDQTVEPDRQVGVS